jgi:thiosulfate/3-mercaptopyruvate sulfurtransferase
MSGKASGKEVLVSTEWAGSHLDDPAVRFVEVDVDTDSYQSGHIPGAVGWNWQTQLQDQVHRDIVQPRDFESLLSQSGIADRTLVVLYGDNNNWFAAWAYWLLKHYGHEQVRLLDGGRKKWLAENRSLATEVPSFPATEYRIRETRNDVRALREDVLRRLGKENFTLVDVRSPDEFTGRILAPPGLNETCQRGGHIPGARNIPWSQAVREDGTFKPIDELRELYEAVGVTPDKEVITYCRIGERSSHSWVVLKELLGYPRVLNYDGSWTEWGNLVNAPIEK